LPSTRSGAGSLIARTVACPSSSRVMTSGATGGAGSPRSVVEAEAGGTDSWAATRCEIDRIVRKMAVRTGFIGSVSCHESLI